jgi:YD repeat-containing protein
LGFRGSVVAIHGNLRKLLIGVLIVCVAGLAAMFAGPVASGAVLLLLPNNGPRADHDLPESYSPLHKGHVGLATGLYTREDEDIVLRGTPALILRRTYLSNYRVTKQFGVGATHTGEWFLIGDGERFAWASLILSDGSRIRFDRVSSGSSFLNAMYEHRETHGEWQGARLGWTGGGWTLRRRDGNLARFLACGEGSVCSLVQTRDADGHTIHYRRERSGRLARIEASADRWIAFDYDAHDRIARAYSSSNDEVRYVYDEGGRLSRVTASDGRIHRYTYTARDQIATIEDPGTTIENTYNDDGRCIRQVNRFPGEAELDVFNFAYTLKGNTVAETNTTRSDGTWSRYTFGESQYTTSEAWGSAGVEPATIAYERDQSTHVVTALTVTCPDRTGRPLRHMSLVKPGREEWIKWDLLRTHCSWRKRPNRDNAGLQMTSTSLQ